MIPSMAGMSSKHASKGFFVSVCPASHSYQTIDHYPLVVVGADLVNAFDGSAALILLDRRYCTSQLPIGIHRLSADNLSTTNLSAGNLSPVKHAAMKHADRKHIGGRSVGSGYIA